MYIFRLIKRMNPRAGSRFIYSVVDRNGRVISEHFESNDIFVAAIVGKHEKGDGRGSVLSVSKYTKTPANLGKSLTIGGRSDVFGIALAETVSASDGTRRTVTRNAKDIDRATRDHDAIDWTQLPAEFEQARGLKTHVPRVPRDSDWIDELPANLGRDRDRPADPDALTKEFEKEFGSAAPAKTTIAGDAIQAELKRRLKTGKFATGREFIELLDQEAGVPPERSLLNDPAAVQRVDELLNALTTDVYLGTAWALFLGRETPEGSSIVTDVREISRARRKLVMAVDDLARKTCDAFIAAMRDEDDVPGSITPDPASRSSSPCPGCGVSGLDAHSALCQGDEQKTGN